MDSRGDGIVKALIGVGAEVDGESGVRRHRSSHFDVEHHLAVGPARITRWAVSGPVDGDGRDGRWINLQRVVEIRLNVARLEAAAELDDCNGLAVSKRVCGEAVGLPDLRWSE